ncbi:MAG: PAS domain S-box protein [Desulfobulbaceae bacterium]|nr:PAS domain S-box protein [Desulfobulbaceae bacterium]
MIAFKIRTHLILSVSLITLLLTSVIVSLYTVRAKEHAFSKLSEYGETIAFDTAYAVADHIINEDYALLQNTILKFATLSNIDTIEISDSDWTMLAATDLNMLGTIMPHTPSGESLKNEDHISVHIDRQVHKLTVTVPIYIGDSLMGHARIFLSMHEILAHIHDIQNKGILSGIFFWMIAVLVGIGASRMLTKPVSRFMQATESISQGDFNVTLPSSKRIWELQRFSSALEVMVHAIEARENDLIASEKKFRHLFERAMEGIFACDSSGIFEAVNPAMLAILGYDSSDNLLPRNFFTDILADHDAIAAFKQQITQQNFVKGYELNLLKKDGSSITASLSCHAERNSEGQIIRYEGLIRDITQQKKASEEIAQMRNYLHSIIESMPSMLITIDKDLIVTQWNSAASHITGIPSTKAIGEKIWNIAPFFRKYIDHVDRISLYPETIKLQREHMGSDKERLFNMTIFPLVTNGTSGIAIRLDDITELETKEKQLQQAQKMESLGTLAGGLAHDFNNVLGGILGNLSLIQFRLDQHELISEEELREYVKSMSTGGYRAADLVRQLLTLSRKQKIELVPVDLNLSIKHVRKISENTFDRSVKINIQMLPAPAYCLADPSQIEQVILNICINAAHSMTIMRGETTWGGDLTVSLKKMTSDRIFCQSHPDAKEGLYWVVSISDTGVGMDSTVLAKIFDPFFTTKEKGKGTGLGLSMAYSIIKQLNGFIDVSSKKNMGSTFNIYLPFLERQIREQDLLKDPLIYPGQGCILVVDDDDIMLETACAILKSAGYDVLAARNGQEGVDIYREKQSSLSAILLDLVMPIMSGKETYLEIKKINPDAKVLLSSGFRHDERVDDVMQLGVNGFLQKPYTMENLTKTMKEILAE